MMEEQGLGYDGGGWWEGGLPGAQHHAPGMVEVQGLGYDGGGWWDGSLPGAQHHAPGMFACRTG